MLFIIVDSCERTLSPGQKGVEITPIDQLLRYHCQIPWGDKGVVCKKLRTERLIPPPPPPSLNLQKITN